MFLHGLHTLRVFVFLSLHDFFIRNTFLSINSFTVDVVNSWCKVINLPKIGVSNQNRYSFFTKSLNIDRLVSNFDELKKTKILNIKCF